MSRTGWSNIRFAVVTPVGRGAIASVVVIGDNGLELINELFLPAKKTPLGTAHLRRPIYGLWKTDSKQSEDLVVVPLAHDHLEIHCHGGKIATDVISRTLTARGAENVDAMEIGTYIFGNAYLCDFELMLAKSATWRITELILRQREIHKTFFLKLGEAIDRQDLSAAANLLAPLERWIPFGQRLTDGWDVVICGMPNVGKSSLINCLVGFDRAIVHDEAGTTRDTVAECTAIDGWPIRLFDTAGIRDTDHSIERAGIELAERRIAEADLVVLVVDCCQASDADVESQVASWSPDIIVANKCDLAKPEFSHANLSVSAKTKAGIQKLLDSIASQLVPELPEAQQLIPFSNHQCETLRKLKELIRTKEWEQAKSLVIGLNFRAVLN